LRRHSSVLEAASRELSPARGVEALSLVAKDLPRLEWPSRGSGRSVVELASIYDSEYAILYLISFLLRR
jgi:hypothetical protein